MCASVLPYVCTLRRANGRYFVRGRPNRRTYDEYVRRVDTCVYLVGWLRALPSRAVESAQREHSASTASVCSRWCHWWIRAHGRRLATAGHARNAWQLSGPLAGPWHCQCRGCSRVAGHGRSASRALDKAFQPLVRRNAYDPTTHRTSRAGLE